MTLFRVVVLFFTAPVPALTVYTIFLLIGHCYGNDPFADSLWAFILMTLDLYIISLIVGAPLVIFLYFKRKTARSAFIAIGLLVGFLLGLQIGGIQFHSLKNWLGCLIFAFPGGLSGYYVYRFINRK